MSVDWKALYDSAQHHPGVAFVLTGTLVAWLWLRAPKGPLRWVLLALAAETLLDAFFTGKLSPLPADPALGQAVGITFVILGDLRFFLLLERFRSPTATWRSAFFRALAWSFVVPVLQALAVMALPQVFDAQRPIYLVYEALFCALAAGLLVARYPSRQPNGALGWYATRLTLFFLVQYGLWVLSDVLLLSGFEGAWALRLVPNTLYYGLFLWAAARLAPQEAWA